MAKKVVTAFVTELKRLAVKKRIGKATMLCYVMIIRLLIIYFNYPVSYKSSRTDLV